MYLYRKLINKFLHPRHPKVCSVARPCCSAIPLNSMAWLDVVVGRTCPSHSCPWRWLVGLARHTEDPHSDCRDDLARAVTQL